MQDKKQQLEPDMEHWTDSKLGKEYIKAVYCHTAYLTSMQSISCIMPDWMTHKLESIAGRNINNPRFEDDTTLMADSEEELKSLLMKVKEESEKTGFKKKRKEKNWLKTQHSKKQRAWHPVPSVQFSSVAQLCPTLCDSIDWSMPGFPVLHHLPELAQTYVH